MANMTPRERALAAFELEPADKIPIYHVGFSSQVASYILGREAYVGGGIQRWREAKALWQGSEAHREFLRRSLQDAFEVGKAADNDIIRFFYWRLAEKPAKKIDEHTFLYGDPGARYVIRRFVPSSELFSVVEEYPPRRKMTVSSRFEEAERYLSEREEWLYSYCPKREDFREIHCLMEKYPQYAIRVSGGAVGVAIYSDPVWLMAMVSKPYLAARYLDIQAEIAVKKMRYFAEAGVKLLFGGCDIASNDGPPFPPRVFRKLVLPRLQRVTEECHKYGMYFLYGSDGNLWPVAHDLFRRSGVDGYYEIDRRAGMDLHELRTRFPNLVLVGNISSHTLHSGTREEVIAETRSCLREARRSRGIIVGVSNYIVPGTPKENIKAMMRTIKRFR